MQWASHNHNSVGHDSVDDEKAVGKYDYYNKTLGKIEKNTKPDLTKSQHLMQTFYFILQYDIQNSEPKFQFVIVFFIVSQRNEASAKLTTFGVSYLSIPASYCIMAVVKCCQTLTIKHMDVKTAENKKQMFW